MYKKSITLILAIVALILLIGCSKQPQKETPKEEKTKVEKIVKKGDKLEENLNEKYIHIVENQNDTGTIYYFKNNEIILLYGYHADSYKIEDRKSDNNLIYNLSSKEFGNPNNTINSFLHLSQNEDETLNMMWNCENGNCFEKNNLKLLTAEECVQSIVSSYPSYKHDRNWEEFGLTQELFNQAYDEIQEEELSKQITEEEALELCKEKVKDVWDADSLTLGTDDSGLDKVIELNGHKYYGIYYINDGMAGDFRFCVNASTGEVFFQSSADLQSLTAIDEYLQEFN
ncbi:MULTISPECIES: hypothetical protein [Terrisporobacter]|nr:MULTISPECIES: hypothetical protein [Terrisporobacter]MCC3669349.1 hypothetical protein [Terrisporobacter mayombei]MDY3374463.1 hypothetical protein [Terrisporobacter othiniensis]